MAEPPGACYYGGGNGDHVWMRFMTPSGQEYVGCRDCPAELPLEKLLEVYTEYNNIVQTGIAVITGELEEFRADLDASARNLGVSLDEMPPGSTMRRVMMANSTMRRERQAAQDLYYEMRGRLMKLLALIEEGRPHYELASALADSTL